MVKLNLLQLCGAVGFGWVKGCSPGLQCWCFVGFLGDEAEFTSAVWSCGLWMGEGLFSWSAVLVFCWFSGRVLVLVLEV